MKKIHPVILNFIKEVYGDKSVELVLSSFDEISALEDATDLIKDLRKKVAKTSSCSCYDNGI
jgi:hypothetical protein